MQLNAEQANNTNRSVKVVDVVEEPRPGLCPGFSTSSWFCRARRIADSAKDDRFQDDSLHRGFGFQS
eukprot:scaffold544460_cov39-Prasinocladus_malaysianus.AAC.1